MKCIIHGNKNRLATEGVFDEQFRKHELENELKIFEKYLPCDENIGEYHICKADLQKIYHNIAVGVKIRSKCQWYEESEKLTKYFLNLDKKPSRKIYYTKISNR